jgi:hypothetical protein
MKTLETMLLLSACLLLASCSRDLSSKEPSDADIKYTIQSHIKGSFTLLQVRYDDGKSENVKDFQLLTGDGGMKSIGLRREADGKWYLNGDGIHWEVLHAEPR